MSKQERPDGELLYHAACIGDDCSSSDGKRKVHGVGINDADYPVTKYLVEGKKKTQIWMCPYYNQWKHILERGHSSKFKKKNPSYLNVRVNEKWYLFSNFKAWMMSQDWEGMELDKDILVENNLEYSEKTCCFVPQVINKLLIDRFAGRGEFPLGVSRVNDSKKNPYKAAISHNNTRLYLGVFPTPEKAHRKWQLAKAEKIEQAVDWWENDSKHIYDMNTANRLLEIAEKLRDNARTGVITLQI